MGIGSVYICSSFVLLWQSSMKSWSNASLLLLIEAFLGEVEEFLEILSIY